MTNKSQVCFKLILQLCKAGSVKHNGIFLFFYACGKALDSVQLIPFLDDFFIGIITYYQFRGSVLNFSWTSFIIQSMETAD